jgi:hypothetical protein
MRDVANVLPQAGPGGCVLLNRTCGPAAPRNRFRTNEFPPLSYFGSSDAILRLTVVVGVLLHLEALAAVVPI